MAKYLDEHGAAYLVTKILALLQGKANTEDIPEEYTLPTATSNTLGGIKVGEGLAIDSGVLSATGNNGVAMTEQEIDALFEDNSQEEP